MPRGNRKKCVFRVYKNLHVARTAPDALVADGSNFFAYCGYDPVNNTDPAGGWKVPRPIPLPEGYDENGNFISDEEELRRAEAGKQMVYGKREKDSGLAAEEGDSEREDVEEKKDWGYYDCRGSIRDHRLGNIEDFHWSTFFVGAGVVAWGMTLLAVPELLPLIPGLKDVWIRAKELISPGLQRLGGQAGAVGNLGSRIDPNKLHHIFDKAGRGLDILVSKFGSQEGAFSAIHSAAQALVRSGRTDVFKELIDVGGIGVVVKGRIVDDVFRIGSAWLGE